MEPTPLETVTQPPASDVAPAATESTRSIAAALELADAISGYRGKRVSSGRWRRLVDAFAVLAIAFGAVGIFVLGMFVHSRVSDGGASASTLAQRTSSAQPTVSADDDPSRGPADARVTVIEYADFQCPYCGRFHVQTWPQLLQQYGDRVRFVYRDFPLSALHPYAEKAAEAGDCAQEQGKFWEYHDALYTNQTALDRASLSRYAQNVGLDTARFDSCVDSGKHAAEVANDLQEGTVAGVTGTPAFLVNGKLITGAQPFSVFQTAIDAALANAN